MGGGPWEAEGAGFRPQGLLERVFAGLAEVSAGSAAVGGASVPTLSRRIAAKPEQSVGAEVLPHPL